VEILCTAMNQRPKFFIVTGCTSSLSSLMRWIQDPMHRFYERLFESF
jgi:Leu/Phe-tRNA-protein transferase